MSDSDVKSEIHGLNALKLMCALMVVLIHFSTILRPYVQPICRLAVPLFFMISGYFLVDDEGSYSGEKIKRRFIRIFKIAVLANVVYIILSYHDNGFSYSYVHDKLLTVRYWRQIALFGNQAMIHLWYLTSYLQVLIILYLLVGLKKSAKVKLLAILVCLSINLLLGSYNYLINGYDLIFLWRPNVITTGLPFVLAGMLLREFKDKIPSLKTSIILFTVCVVFLYVEYVCKYMYLPGGFGDIVLFTTPAAICFFAMAYRLNSQAIKYMGVLGKKYSLDIYLWHMLLPGLVFTLWGDEPSTISGFLIILATMIFAFLLHKIGIRRLYV